MLTNLSLHNFKSWKEIKQMWFAPITGLFGPNSSGKTSILQLLLMLKQTVESPDRKQALNLGDERSLVNLGTFRDVILGHDEQLEMEWMLEWSLPDQLEIADPDDAKKVLLSDDSLRFAAKLQSERYGRPTVSYMGYLFDQHIFHMTMKDGQSDTYTISAEILNENGQPEAAPDYKFRRTRGRPWPLPPPVKCYGFPPQISTYYENAEFLSDFELAFQGLFDRVFYLGPLPEHPRREYTWAGGEPPDVGRKGQHAIEAILASNAQERKISRGRGRRKFTVEEYVAWWLKELDLIHSFSVEPVAEGSNLYRVWVRQSPKAAQVLITDVGFGLSQLLAVLTLCYYVPERSILILEQPEIHLHPSVQAGLADVFIDAVEKRNIQILVESHSEHLLRRLQLRIAEGTYKAGDAALYFCDLYRGRSRLTELALDLFGNITNWPEGFFGDPFGETAAMAKAQLERKKAANQ